MYMFMNPPTPANTIAETVQQLLAKDADSAANLLEQLHYLWSLPLQLTAGLGIIFYLVWQPNYAVLGSLGVHAL